MGRSLRAGIPGSWPFAPDNSSLAAAQGTCAADARSCSWVAHYEPGYPARGRPLLTIRRSLRRRAPAPRTLAPGERLAALVAAVSGKRKDPGLWQTAGSVARSEPCSV